MSPVDRAGSLTGTNFTLGSYKKFQPDFRDEKRPKTSCGAKFEKQSKHGELSCLLLIALATLIAVSLQLNGMLMMWKIQQAMQDDAEFIRRIHPGNRAEVFIWQNVQPGSYEDALSEKKQRWRKGQTAGRDGMACGRLL